MTEVFDLTTPDALAPAPTEAPGTLLTIDQLKIRLGIGDGSQDAILAEQGLVATAVLQNYLGRQLVYAQVVEIHNNVSDPVISLSEWPVIKVNTILKDDGVDLLPSLKLHFHHGKAWLDGANWIGTKFVTVNYDAGYEVMPEVLADTYARVVQARVTQGGASAATGSGTGAIKGLTIFDVAKIDYDTSAQSERQSEGAELAQYEAVLAQFMGSRGFGGLGIA